MTKYVDAKSLKAMLNDGDELAILDIREEGEFGLAHMLYAVPLPYSILEMHLANLVPRRSTRAVLVDNGDGTGKRAASRMADNGYTDISLLKGGMASWNACGYEVFMGVNVPCKAFGEMVEHAANTPNISPDKLYEMLSAEEKVLVLDGRTAAEFSRMSIPHGLSVPNAELVYQVHGLAPDPETTIVVNCAGRTRSIIGAQTLINAGVPNKVFALKGGTMGWRLSGYELDHGNTHSCSQPNEDTKKRACQYAARIKEHWKIREIDRNEIASWKTDEYRTTYFLDVRSQKEFEAGHFPGSILAPGGQLIQSTDQWCGTRRSRILLLDDESNVRAITTAHWLLQMGWDAYILKGGIGTDATEVGINKTAPVGLGSHKLEVLNGDVVAEGLQTGAIALADVDISSEYIKTRLPGAIWGVRPRAETLLSTLAYAPKIVLYSMHETRARAAAIDLQELTEKPIAILQGGKEKWMADGHPIETTPKDTLRQQDRIDFLFWAHDRHQGNNQSALDYLAWEEQLPKQIQSDGDATFNIITL